VSVVTTRNDPEYRVAVFPNLSWAVTATVVDVPAVTVAGLESAS
jgi:hypothetical protein